MSRKAEFVSVSEKPATKYFEWASEDKSFKYYDKSEKKNINVPLPLRFLVLKEFHTVKGWHDPSQSGLYSNEVPNIGQDPLEVKSFKGGLICKGIYKDIKEQVQANGGHYVKSIYAMLENGDVVNFQLKGSAVQEWGEAFNKCRNRFADEWVICEGAEDRKKGRVNYSVPVFKFNGVTSDQEAALADEAYERLGASLKVRSEESPAYRVEKENPAPIGQELEDDDDLPF